MNWMLLLLLSFSINSYAECEGGFELLDGGEVDTLADDVQKVTGSNSAARTMGSTEEELVIADANIYLKVDFNSYGGKLKPYLYNDVIKDFGKGWTQGPISQWGAWGVLADVPAAPIKIDNGVGASISASLGGQNVYTVWLSGDEPNKGRLSLYVYYPEQNGQYGDVFVLCHDAQASNIKNYQCPKDRQVELTPAQWGRLQTQVTVNDGGQSNGEVVMTLDGKKVLHLTDIKFRNTNDDNLLAKGMILDSCLGGKADTYKSNKNEYIMYDNFVLADNFIPDAQIDTQANPDQLPKKEPLINIGKAYTNPFSHQLKLEVYAQVEGKAQVQLMDLSGRVVAVLHDGFLAQGNHEFDLSQKIALDRLATGMYLLNVIGANGVIESTKVIKQ
jgi:hypothetical protein